MGSMMSGQPQGAPPLGSPMAAKSANNNQQRVVLIPIDESKQAEKAFDWYVSHVHKPGNVVRVIHCQELHNPSLFYDLKTSSIEESVHKAKIMGSSIINKYESKLKRHQIPGSVHSEFGPTPGEVVINAADRYNASHIVMGSRGLGAIRRTILGSVSAYVIHHTKVPVTVVPRDDNQGAAIF